MTHIEVHICNTARDAAYLSNAGLPRFDLEPGTKCSACTRRVGEVLNRDGDSVGWKRLGVVLTGDRIDVLCGTCLRPFDKLLAA